jgi:hypothetical protein
MTFDGVSFQSTRPITLPADPVVGLQSATKQYVDNTALLLTGGHISGSLIIDTAFVVGGISTLSDLVTFGNPGLQFSNSTTGGIKKGATGASLAASDIQHSSWFGVGFTTNNAGQTIPPGLNAVYMSARTGDITTARQIQALGAGAAPLNQLGWIRFRRTGNDAHIDIDANTQAAASVTLAAGGSGWVLNDRAYDAQGLTYTVTAVSGDVATTVTQQSNPAFVGTAPANPVALTAVPPSVGIGLTVNVTWQLAQRLAINNATATGTVAIQSGGIDVATFGASAIVFSQSLQVPAATGVILGASGPTIRGGTGAATGTQPSGSLWVRTDGSAGARIYVSAGAAPGLP